MNRFYKYGFWILVITIITLLNYGRIYQKRIKTSLKLEDQISDKRISSLFASNTIFHRKINSVDGIEIIKGSKKVNIFKGKVLVILLSDFKCDRCQLNELKRLLKIEKKLKSKGINIVGITTKDKTDILISQIKISHIDFPIYYIPENIFYNKLSFSKDFPQIIFVSNRIITSSFKPVVKDDKFSEDYYAGFLSIIKDQD